MRLYVLSEVYDRGTVAAVWTDGSVEVIGP